ncbi:hypothetical protein ACLB6G_14070 [Zhengella sp. ZM62]
MDVGRGKGGDPSSGGIWQDAGLEGQGEKRKPGRLERLMRLFAPVI